MASRRSRALDAAIATSLLQSLNWMNNWAPYALPCESMRWMPDIADRASSAGRNPVRSIPPGVEPGAGSGTTMTGGGRTSVVVGKGGFGRVDLGVTLIHK